jgi:hypothetical protein
MTLRGPHIVAAILLLTAGFARSQAVIEGRVELPKARIAPVMNKRYELVTKGGVIATNPPLAVVYLEGAFPRPGTPVTKQLSQKDYTFTPALLPIQVGTRVSQSGRHVS